MASDRPIARCGLALTLPALALLLGGCGPGIGDVSGKVTYKGKPVVYGSVGFIGPNGLPHAANINPDGTYAVTGVVAGENKITVSSVLPTPPKSSPDRPLSPMIEIPKPLDPELMKKWFPIPADYGDIAKTKLRFPVKRGPNTFDIDLVD